MEILNFFLSGHEQVQTFSKFSYIRRLHCVLPIGTLLKGSKSRCWVNFRQKSEVLSTLLSTDQMFYDNYFEFIRVLSNMENISLIQNGRFKKVLFGLGRKTSQDSDFCQVKPLNNGAGYTKYNNCINTDYLTFFSNCCLRLFTCKRINSDRDYLKKNCFSSEQPSTNCFFFFERQRKKSVNLIGQRFCKGLEILPYLCNL